MKTISQHVEYAKGQPHHIRKRIAFIVAAVGTALIALAWLAVSVSTGAFAIQGSTFADVGGAGNASTSDNVGSGTTGVAGAASAIQQNAPAHIEIIDSTPAMSSGKKAEQTTIPF